jgi:long-subunit fatty acid transport protein
MCIALAAAGVAIGSTGFAKADWAQTMGIGQKSTNLGGAVSATADDYDVFYTNPAGAANFDRPFIGQGIKTFDTRTLSVKQIDAQEIETTPNTLPPFEPFDVPRNGVDISPEKTLPGSAIGVIPSGGAYMPLPGMENLVVGVGVGTPFLVSANYGNDDAPGNYTKFNTTDASLVVVETAPTVGLKVNDKLNIGASLGITTFKYLKLSNALGQASLFGGPGLGTTAIGSATLETDGDFGLPVPPWEFATEPSSVSFTIGMQYKVTPQLAIGATYRSETPETFEGTSTISLNEVLTGTPLIFNDRFKYEMELPRHLQVGFAYDVNPQWRVMADVRWTNWSDAKGFGSASVIEFEEGTLNDTLTVNYAAEDAYSFHFGTAYKITPALELQAGYVYDQAFMPEDAVDLVTLSSNRHILSLGGTYTKPTDEGEWAFTVGGQIALYEDRKISAGESANLGGATDSIGAIATGDLEYSRNVLGGIDIGGYVWSVGASVSYKFGAPSAPIEQTSLEPLK